MMIDTKRIKDAIITREMKLSVFIATSLDGYIARENGELDWLDKANATVPLGIDCGYSSFMDSVDVLIMGRLSYEKVLTFGPWPYGSKKVIVLSHNKVSIPESLSKTVFWSDETPQLLSTRLEQEGAKQLYIDGGATIRGFLAAGLITDVTITVIPILLGSGKPLFGLLDKEILLKHVRTQTYDFGFVQLTYNVIIEKPLIP